MSFRLETFRSAERDEGEKKFDVEIGKFELDEIVGRHEDDVWGDNLVVKSLKELVGWG